MNIHEHFLFTAVLFLLPAAVFNWDLSPGVLIFLLFFSIFPDFDFVVFSFTKKGRKQRFLKDLFLFTLSKTPPFSFFVRKSAQRRAVIREAGHHFWPSHWPLVYSPLIIVFYFYPSPLILAAIFGIYSHFIADSLTTWVLWLAPFSFRPFGLDLHKEKAFIKSP